MRVDSVLKGQPFVAPGFNPGRCGALFLLVLLTACSPAPDQVPVVHDLVAELPAAEIRREVGLIDFGAPASRPHLREGWYQNERGRRGRTVVWSQGPRSAVDVWLAAPRPLQATLRCAPFAPPDGRPQEVTVLLNSRRIGALSLRPQLDDYALELPVEAQTAGSNRLEFQYRRVTRFQHRDLAVSWDLLRLTPGPAASAAELPRATPRPGGQAPALYLPSGTEAGYYLALEGGGTLALQGVRGQGNESGALQVLTQEEGGAEKLLETLQAGTGPRELKLPGRGERLVRLALRAVPGNAATPGGGLVLLGPTVRGLANARPRETVAASGPERPHLFLYLIDTLRADRVGASRAGEPLTPNIDAFARNATVFANAIAQSPWTRPSVASIFTGLGPLAHGVQRIEHKLPPEAVTLAELLHAAGYSTAAFSTNWHVHRQSGMDQGFALFDFSDRAPSDQLNERVIRWLDTRPQPPFFLYVHALDPHSPYTPPPEYRDRFAPDARPEAGYAFDLKRIARTKGRERERLIAEMPPLYDAEVAFNDYSFGAFLDALRRRGLYDNSLIVLVSDHGEELGEHGFLGHANNLFHETLDVPLIVKWPGQRQGKRVRALAQHVDLLPTLLRAAGLQAPEGLPGMDLAQVAASGEDPESLGGRRALSHLRYRGREGISVIHAGWKLIHPLTRELSVTSQLYHRPTDRAERTNRLGDLPVRAGWLESLVRLEQERSRSGFEAQTSEMDEETRKALEALGYL